MIKPELMAPAGDWIMLRAAVDSGADAVYLGLKSLTMRATAKNFCDDELKEVVDYCHENEVKVYLTLNSIVFEHELERLDEVLKIAKEANVDMIICWDQAVIKKAVKEGLQVCVSTQASVSNSEAAKFYRDLGCKRVVLARECTLEQIKNIKQELGTSMEVEVFIHGAMCVALSGRCFMSHHLFGKSANCGDCVQPCRREYLIKDTETLDEDGNELVVGKGYVMSAKDLCTIEFIDELLEAGLDSFKIEGRKRSPEYVAKAVAVYREAIDLYFKDKNKLSKEKRFELKTELEKVFNRGFNSGFYYGTPFGKNSVTDVYGSKATEKKVQLGFVKNFYDEPMVAFIELTANNLSKGDKIMIQGVTSGVIELVVTEIRDEEENIIAHASKGTRVSIKLPSKARKNDQVYKLENKER